YPETAGRTSAHGRRASGFGRAHTTARGPPHSPPPPGRPAPAAPPTHRRPSGGRAAPKAEWSFRTSTSLSARSRRLAEGSPARASRGDPPPAASAPHTTAGHTA